jgi:hypothetical protein
MYDHQTESLWSQVLSKAVAGPLSGRQLKILSSTLTKWSKWKNRYPETYVLSLETGYERDYSRDPYAEYYEQTRGFLSLFRSGPGEEEKQLVAGIKVGETVKAYPLDLLRKKEKVMDKVENKEITLTFDPETDVMKIKDRKGKEIPYITAYWFVWKGIHPETYIYKVGE